MIGVMEFIRRRSGSVATASAIVGFAAGALGAYQVVHTHDTAQILLRQATEGDPMATFDETPGAGGVLILLRNDSTTPVEVIDAAFARTSAAPPLYIAPDTVQPGAEVNVYAPVPGKCFGPPPTPDTPPAPPVQILVSARQPGGPIEFVPVEVIGAYAQIIAACHNR